MGYYPAVGQRRSVSMEMAYQYGEAYSVSTTPVTDRSRYMLKSYNISLIVRHYESSTQTNACGAPVRCVQFLMIQTAFLIFFIRYNYYL